MNEEQELNTENNQIGVAQFLQLPVLLSNKPIS